MRRAWCTIVLVSCLACGGSEAKDPVSSRCASAGLGLVLTTTFETGSLDTFCTDAPSEIEQNLLVASGDAVLRQSAGVAYVLGRGGAGYIQKIQPDVSPGTQIALPDCGPHDVIELPDERLLVSCYDDALMRIVDPVSSNVVEAPNLAAFADDDELPETDQMVIRGDRVFVTLQLIDRQSYRPTSNGKIVVLDAHDLEVLDQDPSTAGVQAIPLPCPNPYTRLEQTEGGRLLLGCAGDFQDLGGVAVVALDPVSGESEILADGQLLEGALSELRAAPARGSAVALIASPNGWQVDEMRVVEIDSDGVSILHSSPGFSLAGLEVDEVGTIYFGRRTADDSVGLWLIESGSSEARRAAGTGLPPFDIEIL